MREDGASRDRALPLPQKRLHRLPEGAGVVAGDIVAGVGDRHQGRVGEGGDCVLGGLTRKCSA